MTASLREPVEGVWAELVGQARSVEVLRRAVAGEPHAMSHAWLITGPPGSGRSNAARAFAAALQCERGGCGQCSACRTSLSGAHPDVTLVRTEQLSIGVDEVRELVRRAAMSPTLGGCQVLVVEDADRVTERGADALLKSIEEPAPRTVWLLCAPTADDVVATIRSRCRLLTLQTPPTAAVAELLQTRDGVDPALAAYAARVAQGHIGRARALARDENARLRRPRGVADPAPAPGPRHLSDRRRQSGRGQLGGGGRRHHQRWTPANGPSWRRRSGSAPRAPGRARRRPRSRNWRNSRRLGPSGCSATPSTGP